MAKLTLYKSRTIHAATEGVLSEIGREKGRHIVIAPDAFTLAIEQMISDKLGKEGIFHVEVMSFARLASVVLGDRIKKCLSPYGSVMLMEKVLLREEGNLRHYRLAARKPGFASEIYAAITSIRNSGVTPERLFDALPKLKGRVREKTHDLALLYQAYLTELLLNHTDGTSRLEALVSELDRREDLGDVHFSIVDHVDLNAKQVEVVAALVRNAASVSVAIPRDQDAGNGRIYPKLYDKLCRVAKEEKVRPEEISCECALSENRAVLADELFAYSFATAPTDPSLTLAEAKDTEEEITYLATEITRLVRKENLRFSDVAVLTPSFEEYRPHVERIFRQYDIPLFSDERYPLSDSSLFRCVIGAMETVERSFDPLYVKKHVFHPLFSDASVEEKADFCDYIDRSGVNHSLFEKEFALFKDSAEYAAAEKVRSLLMRELSPLASLPSSATIRDYANALRAYLIAGNYEEKIGTFLNDVREAGLRKEAEILRRSPAALMDLLSTLEDLRGEEQSTFAEFILSLKSGAGQLKIASLPVRLDCVYFAPVEQAMYAPIPALFVLGAEDGLFPLESVKEGIIGSREYAAWQSNGIEIKIENTGVESLAASKFHALQVLLRGERIGISHVEAKALPSCMSQIAEIFSLTPEKCSDLLDRYPIEDRIPTRKVAEAMLVEYSRRSREGLLGEKDARFALAIARSLGKEFPLPYAHDAPERVDPSIFLSHGMISSSELETYFDCPFQHFVKYGLHAKEREVADRDDRDYGNMAHACMQKFLEEYVLTREKDAIDDDTAAEIVRKLAEKEAAAPRFRSIAAKEGEATVGRMIDRCVRVAIDVKNQIYRSDFIPTFLEKDFGERRGVLCKANGEVPTPALVSPKIEGLFLTGRIDRVDLLKEKEDPTYYAVAIDYKTGSNKISISDLFFGKKVQLPLYLSVLESSGYRPIAALYASLNDNRKEAPYLYGPKLAHLGLMRKLDETLSDGKSLYTGISMKGGDLNLTKGSVLSEEEDFRALSDYALKVSAGAIREIREGFIRPSPIGDSYTSSCTYCGYQSICRHKNEACRKAAGDFAPAQIKEILSGGGGEC